MNALRSAILISVLVVGWVGSGCASSPRSSPTEVSTPPAPDAAATSGRFSAKSNAGAYVVSYTPQPDPIPLNQLFTLRVQVTPTSVESGKVAEPILRVDAAMPEHGHGMNTLPMVIRRPDGTFDVRGMQFHMPGKWELYFDVTSGGTTERAQFVVNLR